MTEKKGIVERLGDTAVLLPDLLARALEANERAKMRMTVLQDAQSAAKAPGAVPVDLSRELRAAGLGSEGFDAAVSGARLVDGTTVAIPNSKALVDGLIGDLKAMLSPIAVMDAKSAGAFEKRLDALSEPLLALTGDTLPLALIGSITSATRGGADSIHLLVMDLHKAINAAVAQVAVETVDGASVHGLNPDDKQRVSAFMKGLHRTCGLAFGHPGLGTTATRSGPVLIIQNDIGTTDAHVIVIHVEGLSAAVTYTDVHRARTRFFMDLFKGQQVQWSPLAEEKDASLAGGAPFFLVTGRFEAADFDQLDDFLAYLGSRLVFMIDWNKARKCLRNFVPNALAKDILTWAAANDFGHRGLLALGGAEAVNDAVRRLSPARVPYGKRLDAALGPQKAAEFLKAALKLASKGLKTGRSEHLIKDEIHAALASQFEVIESTFYVAVVRHLGISRTMAELLAEALMDDALIKKAKREQLALRSRRLEQKADMLTVATREIAARLPKAERGARFIIDAVEDGSDALEEAAFLLSLLPDTETGLPANAALAELVRITKASIGELVRATEAAAYLPEGKQIDVTDALQAIGAVIDAEKRADDALRQTLAVLVAGTAEARLLLLSAETARAIETCTDHLSRSALALRERILSGLKA